MTGGIEYGKYGTHALAQSPRIMRGIVKNIPNETATIRTMLLDAQEWDLRDDRYQLRFEYKALSRENAHDLAVKTLHEAGIDHAELKHHGVRAFIVTLPAAAYDKLTAYTLQPKPEEAPSHVSRVPRGPVKVLASATEVALYQRAVNANAWTLHGDTAYLNIPIPPLKPLKHSDDTLRNRTLFAELFLEKSAALLEKHFGVTNVQGNIDHEDGGTIQMRVDAAQYHEKIEARAKEKIGASR